MSEYGTVQKRKRGRPKKQRAQDVSQTGPAQDVSEQTSQVLTDEPDMNPAIWTHLDPSTRAMRIEGLGCLVWVMNAVCFVPGVKVKDGRLVKDTDEPELPASAALPGWPQELHNTDGQWYWRMLDGNPDLGQLARYVKMLCPAGTKALSFDGEFHLQPRDNQQYGSVQFEALASEALPDNATWPKAG
jgi:hypothetical protein